MNTPQTTPKSQEGHLPVRATASTRLLEAPDARLRELEAAAWDFYTVLAPACPTPADCRCYVCTAVRHLKAALDRAKGAV